MTENLNVFQKLEKVNDTVKARSQLLIKKAVLYDNLTAKTDMLKVRILPDMVGFAEDDLPNYGYFNPTQIIKGVAEKSTGNMDTATKLWIICTEDFLVGWIFCEANDQYNIEDTSVSDAWGFNKFKEHLLRCHLDTDSATYSDLKVLFNNIKAVSAYNEAGLSSGTTPSVGLDVVNVRTGERFMMLQSGTTFALTQSQIYLRAGSPDQHSSTIRIQPGSIEITADNLVLYGRNKTSLGKHGMQLCGMLGAPTGLDGSPLVPLLDVTC